MASQDKKVFDKYLKFLTYKVAQVVIQSKQGRLIKTRSEPHGNEWFNVTIEDDMQIVNALKRSLEGRLPQQECPVSVEIAMETLEGERLVLEVWSVDVDYSKRDVGMSVTHLLYPRLSLMLRSLIAKSRTTPAYRLSRQQEENIKFNFTIFARPLQAMEGFKTMKFVKTVCPHGTVSLILNYRERIVFPDRSSEVGVAERSLLEDPTDSIVGESLSARPLSFPFAPSESLQQHRQPKTSDSPQLFSAILPRPSASGPQSSLSPQTSRQESSTSCTSDKKTTYSRENSDNSPRHPREADSFIMVDFTPTFACSDGEDVNHFLQPSSEIPDLDMFNEDSSMDLTAAMKIIGSQS